MTLGGNGGAVNGPSSPEGKPRAESELGDAALLAEQADRVDRPGPIGQCRPQVLIKGGQQTVAFAGFEPGRQRHVELPRIEDVRIAPASKELILARSQPGSAALFELDTTRRPAKIIKLHDRGIGERLQCGRRLIRNEGNEPAERAWDKARGEEGSAPLGEGGCA